MGDSLPAIIVGGLLLLAAAIMAWSQHRLWKRTSHHETGDSLAQRHARRRYFRRMQISLLIAVEGVAIPLGDWLPAIRQNPAIFALYWLGVLLLACWIGLLAVGDLAATSAYGRAARSRLDQERRDLEAQVAQHRRQQATQRRTLPPPSLN